MADAVTVGKRGIQPIKARRPWVDSGMIERTRGEPRAGSPVRLATASGEFLAWGLWSGDPRFPIRIVTWDPSAVLDRAYFQEAAVASARRRDRLVLVPETDAVRLIFGEADGLPGLVVDRLREYAVVKLEGRCLLDFLPPVAEALMSEFGLTGVLLRGDDEASCLAGEMPPERLTIHEGDLRFVVHPSRGQKTGWFCDQRENRLRVAAYAGGASVLDVFSYSGAFSVAAMKRGARSVHLIDSSASGLELARENMSLNGIGDGVEIDRADAFARLRALAKEGRKYDLVIVDPPKLQPAHGDSDRAEGAYLSLQGLAMKLVRPGGRLATFSCSGAMSRARFDGVVSQAAGDRHCRVLERLRQPADHPVLLSFAKSEYLTGLILEMS